MQRHWGFRASRGSRHGRTRWNVRPMMAFDRLDRMSAVTCDVPLPADIAGRQIPAVHLGPRTIRIHPVVVEDIAAAACRSAPHFALIGEIGVACASACATAKRSAFQARGIDLHVKSRRRSTMSDTAMRRKSVSSAAEIRAAGEAVSGSVPPAGSARSVRGARSGFDRRESGSVSGWPICNPSRKALDVAVPGFLKPLSNGGMGYGSFGAQAAAFDPCVRALRSPRRARAHPRGPARRAG